MKKGAILMLIFSAFLFTAGSWAKPSEQLKPFKHSVTECFVVKANAGSVVTLVASEKPVTCVVKEFKTSTSFAELPVAMVVHRYWKRTVTRWKEFDVANNYNNSLKASNRPPNTNFRQMTFTTIASTKASWC